MGETVIYILLPIYNEEPNLRELIPEIRSAMRGRDYKIIAVNDGSLDQSLEILKTLKDGNLLIESSHINMNVGAVFSTGINRVLAESQNDDDIAVMMEADQTSALDTALQLMAEIDKRNDDVVIASRHVPGGRQVNFPLMRRIYSSNASRFLRRLCYISENVHDYTIFLRAYRVKILRKGVEYFGNCGLIQSRGFVANAELLIKLAMLTDRISEIPFVYDYGKKKGKSKIKIFRTINEYFTVISYLREVSRKLKRFHRSPLVGETLKISPSRSDNSIALG